MAGRTETKLFPWWWGYLVAVASVAIATGLKSLAQPSIIPANVPILYFLAIVPTAIFFGFGPSIFVAILSVFAFDYYFIPPLHQFNVRDPVEAPIVAIFLFTGLTVSYLASNLRRKNAEASREITRPETERSRAFEVPRPA